METYRHYDVVFMDIQLPLLDGMYAAQRLRQIDDGVVIVFITSMAQLAIKGYGVNALDFIVKPVDYAVIASKMKRIVRAVENNRKRTLLLAYNGTVNNVDISSITYFEVCGHLLTVHLADGRALSVRKSLTAYEKQLSGSPHFFLRSNHFCLVNPRYITKISGGSLFMGETELPISRAKLKGFMAGFARFAGQRA